MRFLPLSNVPLILSFVALVLGSGMAFADGDPAAIELYTGYGTPNGFLVQGRVIEGRDSSPSAGSDSWLTNLWRNVRRFGNEEVDNFSLEITVNPRKWTVVTDSEGYFELDVADAHLPNGWHRVSTRAKDSSATIEGNLLIVPDSNMHGVISDIDDTLLVSDVNRKTALLANTFLKNPLQRTPVPGAARAIVRLIARNPTPETSAVIYLSASPRQLYGNITEYLNHQQFPAGVLLAKRVTDDGTSDPLFDQFAYKVAKIEDIFRRLPNTQFTLLGDDGEKDPEIYHDIVQRFPQRVNAVYIRRVHPDSNRTQFPEQADFASLLGELP